VEAVREMVCLLEEIVQVVFRNVRSTAPECDTGPKRLKVRTTNRICLDDIGSTIDHVICSLELLRPEQGTDVRMEGRKDRVVGDCRRWREQAFGRFGLLRNRFRAGPQVVRERRPLRRHMAPDAVVIAFFRDVRQRVEMASGFLVASFES
jgi:hypothetical protein